MSELRGLISMGVVLYPPYMGDWPRKIGQFILNFGAIELMSYQYLLKLESTRIDFNRNLNSLLKARIDRIIELIDHTSDIEENLKGELKQIRGDVKVLSEWRNRIAHNPILPTWKPGSDEVHSPPDLLGAGQDFPEFYWQSQCLSGYLLFFHYQARGGNYGR